MINYEENNDKPPELPYTVSQELSKSLIQSFPPPYASSTKRVSTDTAAAMSEVLRIFVVEAHARASVEVRRNASPEDRTDWCSEAVGVICCIIPNFPSHKALLLIGI
jgi:hypothetical protein